MPEEPVKAGVCCRATAYSGEIPPECTAFGLLLAGNVVFAAGSEIGTPAPKAQQALHFVLVKIAGAVILVLLLIIAVIPAVIAVHVRTSSMTAGGAGVMYQSLQRLPGKAAAGALEQCRVA